MSVFKNENFDYITTFFRKSQFIYEKIVYEKIVEIKQKTHKTPNKTFGELWVCVIH